ncbi:MAG: hypothetical protein B6240_13710 [Desulfobacteraceae bacterium 4572_87]|nr:MAG: hypothetical protein B6240_13710 [Desulfobacteraceae bacterium 4572_87]
MKKVLGPLPRDFPLAVVVAMHRHPHSDAYLEQSLNNECGVRVKQADEKEIIMGGTVYFAPPNYHLLVEDNHVFSLSVAQAVHYARPSIDVLFESAAYVYGDSLAGLILTGANRDGAEGLKKIKAAGGLVLVQDPATAEADAMPRAAIKAADPDHILPLDKIGIFLNDLVRERFAAIKNNG